MPMAAPTTTRDERNLWNRSLRIFRELRPDTIAQMALWRDEGWELEVKVRGKCVVQS